MAKSGELKVCAKISRFDEAYTEASKLRGFGLGELVLTPDGIGMIVELKMGLFDLRFCPGGGKAVVWLKDEDLPGPALREYGLDEIYKTGAGVITVPQSKFLTKYA